MLSDERHPFLLERASSVLLIVDVQEAFRTYIPRFGELVAQLTLLVRGARLLGVPVASSEQYPRGLGATIAELATELGDDSVPFEKLEFCACAAEGWQDLPAAVRDARQVVVVGIEAHVCVRQTALALLGKGRDVHVPIDAVASHEPHQRDVSVRELARAGAHETTVEQVLFDWLGTAAAPEFPAVQALLKEHAARRGA